MRLDSSLKIRNFTGVVIALKAAIFFAAVLCFVAGCENRQALSPGYQAPDLKLKAVDGSTKKLSDLKGQAILLNFWASWCAPCMAEMPALQRASQILAGSGVKVVGLGVGETPESVRSVSKDLGLTFDLFAITLDESAKFKVSAYPETFVLDSQGRLVLFRDPDTDEPTMRMAGGREWDSADAIGRLKSVGEKN